MADKENKKLGRPRKTSVEESVINEKDVERLDMANKNEKLTTVEDMVAAWKNTFSKLMNLDQKLAKNESQLGIGTTIQKWNKLNPFLQNERIKNLFTQPGTYTKQELNTFLADPARNERQLRAAGWTNSSAQQIYYNMLRRSCDIPLYKYFVIPEDESKASVYKSEEFINEYRLVSEWLETLNVTNSFKTMALQIKREGKQSYILRNKIIGSGKSKKVAFAAFEKMPTEWIKITGIGQLGYTISFNMMYFLNIANNPSDFGEFFVNAWNDMNQQGIIEEKDGKKQLNIEKAGKYEFFYGNNKYNTTLESIPHKKNSYMYWLRLPFDLCYTFGSDNSHAWCAPDTMGSLRSLQELTDYGQLAGLIASTPLTAILTGEVDFIEGARAGKNETKLSPEVISGLQDIFNATTSTNIEAMFFPLSNIKLQQLQTDVNSSEIISTATENFVETSGEGGLTITTNKPNVSQVKTAQLLAASAQDYVTRQFENVLNYILKNKLGFTKIWKIKIWGDIFSFDGEKKYLKEQVSGGNIALLPKLMSAEGMNLLDTRACVKFITALDFYKDLKTFTQEYQTANNEKQKTNTEKTSTGAGRPKMDDSDIENESTAKSRDDGTNVEGNRDTYSIKKCPICGVEIEEDEDICEECKEKIIEEN